MLEKFRAYPTLYVGFSKDKDMILTLCNSL